MFDFRGIIPPLVTPFDEFGNIRYQDFERNFDHYLDAGVEGYLVLGSNGESVYLEHDEKLRLIEAARRRVPSNMMLLAGVGVESTAATIRLTREAADRGVDGVLVKNPFYYKARMTHDVYVAHYTAVADASPVPVVLYNVPVFTGISFESRTVAELARHPNIRGLKESSGNSQLISEVVWGAGDGFPVLAGAAPTLYPSMAAGARGGIVALACAAPKPLLMLYRAYVSGDLRRAFKIQRVISPAAGVVTAKYGIPGLKAAMAIEGFQSGLPRQPLLPVSPAQRDDIGQTFRRMNSELAELP